MSFGGGGGFREHDIGTRKPSTLDGMLNKKEANPVTIVSNTDKENIQTGRDRLPQFVMESTQSVNFLIDSKDRLNIGESNPFNFTIDLRSNLFRARLATVQKVTFPKINNVNPRNNTIIFSVFEAAVGNATNITAILQPGLYNTNTLSNEISSKLNYELGLIGGYTDTFTVFYEDSIGTFIIEMVGGNTTFIIHNNCSFIIRGKNLCGFSGVDSSTPTGNYYQKLRSGVAGMIYTRFVTFHSAALNQYSYGESRTSDPKQGSDLIAIIDITNAYTPDDYNIGVVYSGTYWTLDTPEAPNLSILNPQRNIQSLIDIQVRDEYGLNLNEAMQVPIYKVIGEIDPVNTVNSSNTLGPSLWLEVSF